MSAAELLSLLGGTSGGTAVVMLVLFIADVIVTKKRYEEMRADRDDWKRIAELERARAEASVQAGQVVKDVMLGLRKELS